MKNLTLSIDDETYRLARIVAAERETTLSAIVRDYLRQLAAQRANEDLLPEILFAAMDKATNFRASERLSREAAHDRARLR